MAIGPSCPRRLCSTAVEFCHNMLHDRFSCVIHRNCQIENFADADCINNFVTNHTIDLYGQIFLGVPCFSRGWVPANVVKRKFDPRIGTSRPFSSASEHVFRRTYWRRKRRHGNSLRATLKQVSAIKFLCFRKAADDD